MGPPSSIAIRTDENEGVAHALAVLALSRLRLFGVLVVVGLSLALALSQPAGIPIEPAVLVLNLALLVVGAVIVVAVFRGRVSHAHAHDVAITIWALPPIATLTSLFVTRDPTLAMLLTIEIAAAALMLDTRRVVVSSGLVTTAACLLLTLHVPSPAIYPVALAGVWVVAMVMQIGEQRSRTQTEMFRLQIQRELDERRTAEAERERLREQFVHAQRLEAVGTLSAGLAHDMNNILAGIMGFAELLREDATDEQTRGDLEEIQREAQRGASLTRSLLAFSRRGQYRRRPLALDPVLDELLPLLARTIGKGVRIDRTSRAGLTIDGDPAQLGQILLNLCLNAADAMQAEGTLTIATDEVEVTAAGPSIGELTPGPYVRLTVADTGAGMDDVTRRQIFEPFFTTKEVGKGTGLGLAMVYGAVQAHGGGIEVHSTPGRGTTFELYFPVCSGVPDAIVKHDSQPLRGLRGVVLVVDDEPMIRTAASRMVTRHGLTAIVARDGREAIEMYLERQDEIAMVLLDMAMPNMPGRDCFHELRKRGARLPILLMSGYVDHKAVQELMVAGARGFLEKPFTPEQLDTELDRILRN